MTANFDLGTEATYSCNTGFFLDVSYGNRSRTCLKGNGTDMIGMWSGQPPTCVCKQYSGQNIKVPVPST